MIRSGLHPEFNLEAGIAKDAKNAKERQKHAMDGPGMHSTIASGKLRDLELRRNAGLLSLAPFNYFCVSVDVQL